MRFETYVHMKMHPIAEDYGKALAPALSRFDAPSPYAAPDRVWAERAARLDARELRLAVDRAAVAEAVVQYNRKHNDVPEAMRAAEGLRDPAALVVAGGQQAGLFTGPMLVVYKAMTILRTAKQASRALGRPVVPVFWIAGEDHDWDEANHTFVVTPQLETRKIAIPHPATDGRTAVSRTTVPPEAWASAIEALADGLMDTEFKPGVLDALRGIADASPTLSDAFAKTMSLLFGKHGLVLIDGDDPGLRAVEAPMFQALIARRDELSAALKAGEREVAALGYPLQAESADDGFNLFLFEGGERKLLFRDGEDAVDRKGTIRMPAEELLRRAGEEPSAFSNNALTRPLMQE